jgi:flagellar protein FlbD
MIQLTKLNKHALLVNADLIKYVEASPDTTITLTNGEKILVLESPQAVVDRIVQYRTHVAQMIALGVSAHSAPAASPAGDPRAETNGKEDGRG